MRVYFKILLCLGLVIGAFSTPASAGLSDSCSGFFSRFWKAGHAQEPKPREAPLAGHQTQKLLIAGARGEGEASLRSYVQEVNHLLDRMEKPRYFTIDFTNLRINFANYLPNDGIAFISPRLAKDFSPQGEKIKRSFVQHEYGHAVFDANFGKHSSEWAEWHRSVEKGDQEIFDPRPSGLSTLTIPYQELFADLLTVTAQKNPDAISSALSLALKKEGSPRVKLREFSGTAFEARWTLPIEVEDGIDLSKDPHLYFAPVRRHLWENYLSRAENQGKESEILKKVFDTIAREILTRYGDASLMRLSGPVLSARLLRALEESLKPYRAG